MKKTSFFVCVAILASFFFSTCDYVAPGSNLMAERYEFDVSKDSLMRKIKQFNINRNGPSRDSLFKIDKNSPYFYEGYIDDPERKERYLVLIPTPSPPPTELLLISVKNIVSNEIIGVNHAPENEEEITKRKLVIFNFQNRILENLGLKYSHTGNAMNKNY